MKKYYPVLLNKDATSAWGVSFVDIPAHIIEDDLDAALADVQEAFEEFLDGEGSLPEPTKLEEVVASESGREALAVALVPIDTDFFKGTSG